MKAYVIYYNERHVIGGYEPRVITASRQAAEKEIQRAKENGCAAYFEEKEFSNKLVRI